MCSFVKNIFKFDHKAVFLCFSIEFIIYYGFSLFYKYCRFFYAFWALIFAQIKSVIFSLQLRIKKIVKRYM